MKPKGSASPSSSVRFSYLLFSGLLCVASHPGPCGLAFFSSLDVWPLTGPGPRALGSSEPHGNPYRSSPWSPILLNRRSDVAFQELALQYSSAVVSHYSGTSHNQSLSASSDTISLRLRLQLCDAGERNAAIFGANVSYSENP